MTANRDTLKQVNKSGFPFQRRVEHEIRMTHQHHGWSVASQEHAWTNPDGTAGGFIDLVLKHDQFVTFRLVIECKRIKADDARQLRWVFLSPNEESESTALASCFEVQTTGDGPSDVIRVWDNVRLWPTSRQSGFCILPSDEQRRQPILETLSAEVLESVEGLAEEELRMEWSLDQPPHCLLFVFPAIVTNAEIAVCRFDPGSISLTDGTLDEADVEITTVPFVRFRKSLATGFPKGKYYQLDAANKARERTVFIVNAKSLLQFLSNWQMQPLPDRDFAFRALLNRS